jgi:4a-hydroxytetrahydrobiopterin dehydratase
MAGLVDKHCMPCQGGVPPLKGTALAALLKELGNGWRVIDEHHLEKEFRYKRYVDGVEFVNRVAKLAEQEGHHPDLLLRYDTVGVQIWTHKIDGLTESDFVFAAKAQALS